MITERAVVLRHGLYGLPLGRIPVLLATFERIIAHDDGNDTKG